MWEDLGFVLRLLGRKLGVSGGEMGNCGKRFIFGVRDPGLRIPVSYGLGDVLARHMNPFVLALPRHTMASLWSASL